MCESKVAWNVSLYVEKLAANSVTMAEECQPLLHHPSCLYWERTIVPCHVWMFCGRLTQCLTAAYYRLYEMFAAPVKMRQWTCPRYVRGMCKMRVPVVWLPWFLCLTPSDKGAVQIALTLESYRGYHTRVSLGTAFSRCYEVAVLHRV